MRLATIATVASPPYCQARLISYDRFGLSFVIKSGNKNKKYAFLNLYKFQRKGLISLDKTHKYIIHLNLYNQLTYL